MTQDNFSTVNRGSAWRNEDRKEDWQAPYTGKANVDGIWYFVDVYGKKAEANPKAPDITFRLKKMDKQPGGEQSVKEDTNDAWSEESQPIPF